MLPFTFYTVSQLVWKQGCICACTSVYLGSLDEGNMSLSLLWSSWNSSNVLWTSSASCWPSRSTFTTKAWKHTHTHRFTSWFISWPTSWIISWLTSCCWTQRRVCGVWTHVAFAGVGGADVFADEEVPDEAITLGRVNAGGEWQRGPIVRRGELHLSQVVDEEVEFGGDAAQTGLDQPVGSNRTAAFIRSLFWLLFYYLNVLRGSHFFN